ncbi:S-adenosyl-L-methionine-dependent methyltransferase [Xylaria grammica]|nr:S-adenosyl-L-methionine-dependent methyltransferase [Xylaria grammica]
MPRLAPSIFRRAGRISPHLVTLLPSCRTIESAQIELRWIRRHVLHSPRPRAEPHVNVLSPPNGEGRDRARPHRVRARIGARQRLSENSRLHATSRKDITEDLIARLVARRGAGEPLQYVLGTQPFGDLDILCEKGVLIPRPETEAWASMLGDLMLALFHHDSAEGKGERLRVLDLCSGTGCIGLSLYNHAMALARHRPPLRLFGFDVEARAVRLARKNMLHNFGGRRPLLPHHNGVPDADAVEGAITFRQADVFTDEWMQYLDNAKAPRRGDGDEQDQSRRINILVSNPPYISQRGFEVDTGRNVRNYEPKIALVPPGPSSLPLQAVDGTCAPEDIFYARLLDIADVLRPRVAAFEVGDMRQAIRVVEMAIARTRPKHRLSVDQNSEKEGNEQMASRWDVLEIWRDWPYCQPSDTEDDVVRVCSREVPLRGSGHGRVVFLVEGQMLRNRFTNLGFRRQFYADS